MCCECPPPPRPPSGAVCLCSWKWGMSIFWQACVAGQLQCGKLPARCGLGVGSERLCSVCVQQWGHLSIKGWRWAWHSSHTQGRRVCVDCSTMQPGSAAWHALLLVIPCKGGICSGPRVFLCRCVIVSKGRGGDWHELQGQREFPCVAQPDVHLQFSDHVGLPCAVVWLFSW